LFIDFVVVFFLGLGNWGWVNVLSISSLSMKSSWEIREQFTTEDFWFRVMTWVTVESADEFPPNCFLNKPREPVAVLFV
jgi:hypothetical protein